MDAPINWIHKTDCEKFRKADVTVDFVLFVTGTISFSLCSSQWFSTFKKSLDSTLRNRRAVKTHGEQVNETFSLNRARNRGFYEKSKEKRIVARVVLKP